MAQNDSSWELNKNIRQNNSLKAKLVSFFFYGEG
jgi:hypothetical protein